ncbi:Glycine cleavage system transcriptional activator [Methylobacterium crusticola]|uniref:Glycine cleavage system transcriptional activator n=1 Tax=Methylobacterium crusticola TaxID=1697972 RepID=A0ABQ4QST4_9HYPH|nr:LysR substrate-binding domain-containing protein [Methylobacterium crusticola]GJD48242.1 Glycine cleavage system transcriptional activator [Methylobacterium crusticola]
MQIPLRSIGVFHAVARMGSVSRAADELCVTPSAVSQQIQALEVHLGTALIVKAGRSIALTEAGERYFEMIGGEVERIAEATLRIRGFRSVMSLNLRATPTLSSKWLLPRLSAFLDAHPDIEVRLDGTSGPTNFGTENVDLEIRHGDGRWPGLYVEGLAEERFLPVCAPALAPPESLEPAELGAFRLIHSVRSQVPWGRWFAQVGAEPAERWRRVLFDRSHMAVDAAAGGLGIALESTLMMTDELRAGLLACPVRAPPAIGLVTQWIVCPHDHLRHRKVQTFLAWLRTERDRWQAGEGGATL